MSAETAKLILGPRRAMLVGYSALAVLVLGIGGWSASAELSGAVIAPGRVDVEGHRQVVEHGEGGVIREVAVDEGARVSAGDVLIRLDGERHQTELTTIDNQLFEILVRRDRLQAERDGRPSVVISEEVKDQKSLHLELTERIAGQIRLFEARKNSLASQIEQFRDRLSQLDRQVVHGTGEVEALRVQLTILKSELIGKERLLKRNLIPEPDVLQLRRERARIQGAVSAAERMVASLQGQQSEIRIEITKLKGLFREEAITELRDLRAQEADLRERKRSLEEILNRTDIRAPTSGIVYAMAVRGVGDVIRPAEPILYIVPQDLGEIILSRVADVDIEEISVGQEVSLRFTALDLQNLPEIRGRLVRISADAIADEATGEIYYEAEIVTSADDLAELEDVKILPGMPVEAFIRTSEQTPLAYLTGPLLNYFNRAFR